MGGNLSPYNSQYRLGVLDSLQAAGVAEAILLGRGGGIWTCLWNNIDMIYKGTKL